MIFYEFLSIKYIIINTGFGEIILDDLSKNDVSVIICDAGLFFIEFLCEDFGGVIDFLSFDGVGASGGFLNLSGDGFDLTGVFNTNISI